MKTLLATLLLTLSFSSFSATTQSEADQLAGVDMHNMTGGEDCDLRVPGKAVDSNTIIDPITGKPVIIN